MTLFTVRYMLGARTSDVSYTALKNNGVMNSAHFSIAHQNKDQRSAITISRTNNKTTNATSYGQQTVDAKVGNFKKDMSICSQIDTMNRSFKKADSLQSRNVGI